MKLSHTETYRDCQRKKPYNSREDAQVAIDRLKLSSGYKGPKKGQKLHAYECPHCYKWHVGNTS